MKCDIIQNITGVRRKCFQHKNTDHWKWMDFSQTKRIESETIQGRFIIIIEGISFR